MRKLVISGAVASLLATTGPARADDICDLPNAAETLCENGRRIATLVLDVVDGVVTIPVYTGQCSGSGAIDHHDPNGGAVVEYVVGVATGSCPVDTAHPEEETVRTYATLSGAASGWGLCEDGPSCTVYVEDHNGMPGAVMLNYLVTAAFEAHPAYAGQAFHWIGPEA